MDRGLLVALAVGILQGLFEWLPISSEGNITVVLSLLDQSPETAVAFALFLHLGTALSAAAYYHSELQTLVRLIPQWRPAEAFRGKNAAVSFFILGTIISAGVGIGAYAILDEVVSAFTGGTVVSLIGVLLIATGVFQQVSTAEVAVDRVNPDLWDTVLVGVAQGLAIFPGVSRSGMTMGILLLRGHEGTAAFRFSFLLSIPAAIGGGTIAYLDTGIEDVTAPAAAIALLTAFLVGYVTIDVLLNMVERVSFWVVCIGLGVLAVLGGVLAM
jgi:undecaprenyl-diphosphatase